nr:uncharacterized protein LOC109159167 [Ipomoea batatas]
MQQRLDGDLPSPLPSSTKQTDSREAERLDALSPKHGGGVLCIQSREHFCKILHLPENNRGWKDRVLSIKYPWPLPVDREWPVYATEHKRPKKSRSLDDAAVKVSAEEYEYEIFRSPEEYRKANLEPPPKYDLPQKYTPQRAAVTVDVRPPLPETGSQGAMRSFPVSARPPAPAKKISLGSKKAGPARPTDPSVEALSAEALVPAGLPLTATHPSNLSSDHGETRAAKHGKEKEADVEEVAPAKRTRRDGSGSTTPMAHSVTDLFARAKDGDEIHRREVAPLKKSLAKRDQRIKELEG